MYESIFWFNADALHTYFNSTLLSFFLLNKIMIFGLPAFFPMAFTLLSELFITQLLFLFIYGNVYNESIFILITLSSNLE